MCKMRVLRLVAFRRFHMPREGASQSRSLAEPLINGRSQEEDSQAIFNFARSCLVHPEIARVELRRSWAGFNGWAAVPSTEEGEYRKEFLLFGLLACWVLHETFCGEKASHTPGEFWEAKWQSSVGLGFFMTTSNTGAGK